jgi:hypothetical protein
MSHFETPYPISVELELRLANVRVTASERADTIVRVRSRSSTKRDDLTAAEQTRVEYADGTLLVKTRAGCGNGTRSQSVGRSMSRSSFPPDHR